MKCTFNWCKQNTHHHHHGSVWDLLSVSKHGNASEALRIIFFDIWCSSERVNSRSAGAASRSWLIVPEKVTQTEGARRCPSPWQHGDCPTSAVQDSRGNAIVLCCVTCLDGVQVREGKRGAPRGPTGCKNHKKNKNVKNVSLGFMEI